MCLLEVLGCSIRKKLINIIIEWLRKCLERVWISRKYLDLMSLSKRRKRILYLFIFEKEYWHVDRKDSSFRVY
jgi:hypothetical protein